ncbi:MAG: hypothetical protein KKF52_05595 [Nanoarchaeota archaeon]|nr:hypothetical protein [Nanoarchaeota archaeon]
MKGKLCICKICEYDWRTRTERMPKACPNCKSYFWDDPECCSIEIKSINKDGSLKLGKRMPLELA